MMIQEEQESSELNLMVQEARNFFFSHLQTILSIKKSARKGEKLAKSMSRRFTKRVRDRDRENEKKEKSQANTTETRCV